MQLIHRVEESGSHERKRTNENSVGSQRYVKRDSRVHGEGKRVQFGQGQSVRRDGEPVVIKAIEMTQSDARADPAGG